MTDNKKNNGTFKVPKIKEKESLERVSTSSSKYKSDILPIIVSNFKKPSISQEMMKIKSAWFINNASAEERHIKCRKMMRKTMPMLSYSVGFFFINSVYQLQKLAKSGEIVNGNITDSHLATSTMGVSLCQYADIYHPGNKVYGIPNEGILVIVKYLKGKINYVPCDPLPMDPQPDFNCHMVKSPMIDSNICCSKAFHNSQVFIYEYTEDGDILNCPSQILPFAAVKFSWYGQYLFKKTDTIRKAPTVNHERMKEIEEVNKALENQKHVTTSTIHKINASSLFSFNLAIKGLSTVEMKSMAYIYFTNPVISLLRSDENWQISGVIEISEFEVEFRRLQINWNSPTSSKDIFDPLSQDFIISLNRPNLLSSADTDSESLLSNKSHNTPQFVTYIRIVLNSFDYSKCLIQYFNLTKTMGFINRPHDPDISILIFPNGKLSKKLGIPSVEDNYYFHALVFHSQHPQFIILNSPSDKTREKDIYFSSLSTLKKQSIQSKLNILKPLITYEVLKQTLRSQTEVQKKFLFNIVKPQTMYNDITYKDVCFEIDCVEYNCWYHNPVKKSKLIEITNIENISNTNDSNTLSIKKKRKITERKCLRDKLFDYFKNTSNKKVDLSEIVEGPILAQDGNIINEKSSPIDSPIQKSDIGSIICNKTNENTFSVNSPINTNKNQISENCNISKESKLVKVIEEEIIIQYKDTDYRNCLLEIDKSDNGSFYPLNFQTYCKASYSIYKNFNIIQFKNPSCFLDERRKSTKDMWSFHGLPLKKIENWPGSSTYT